MRSADLFRRICAVALALGATGCSTVSEPLGAIRQAISIGPNTPAAAGTRSSAAAEPAEAPVSPTIQRSFDDASRALRSGRVDEAERAYRALAQANPELGGPHANLGVIYRQSGKLPEAAAEFERAVRLNPQQPIYLNQLGITYRQLGQFAKARDAYQQAIALDPGYAAPTLNLGILYDLYFGDAPHALEQYGRYLALSPNGDATVTKWVADLKNRKPAPITVSRQEKP